MKILCIHNKYRQQTIGGEDLVFQHEVAALKEAVGVDNVFSYSVCNDNISKIKLIFNIWGNLYHYFRVKKLIKTHKIDIVHLHNFFPMLSPSIIYASKRAGAVVVQTLHNFRWWCVSGVLYRNGSGHCEKCVNKTIGFAAIKNRCYRNSFLQSILAVLSFSFFKMQGALNKVDYFFVLSKHQLDTCKRFGLPTKKLLLKPNAIAVDKVHEHNNKKIGNNLVSKKINLVREGCAVSADNNPAKVGLGNESAIGVDNNPADADTGNVCSKLMSLQGGVKSSSNRSVHKVREDGAIGVDNNPADADTGNVCSKLMSLQGGVKSSSNRSVHKVREDGAIGVDNNPADVDTGNVCSKLMSLQGGVKTSSKRSVHKVREDCLIGVDNNPADVDAGNVCSKLMSLQGGVKTSSNRSVHKVREDCLIGVDNNPGDDDKGNVCSKLMSLQGGVKTSSNRSVHKVREDCLIGADNNPAETLAKSKGLLYVGRIEEPKGIFALLDIWKNLDDSYKLTIIGAGNSLNELNEFKEKYNYSNVDFIGQQPPNVVREHMKSAKYLIQPSLMYETFGLVILEAMSCATPVIGLNVGSRMGLIKQDKTGFLCDLSQLESTIIKAQNYTNYDSLCYNAYRYSMQYSSKKVLAHQISLYRNMLQCGESSE